MPLEEMSIINEAFETSFVTEAELDSLLEKGWRHFGQLFFRYNLALLDSEIRFVTPLRIRLGDFKFSKSQRRVLKKNRDLKTAMCPVRINEEKKLLFEKHKLRFACNVPESIYSFLDQDAANIPCEALEICVYDRKERLVAVSFFDIGKNSISSVYGMFEPAITRRSLGIYTMLLEIQYAIECGKTFYYQGYAYEGDSFYDYKKRFGGLETYDWIEKWTSLPCNSKTSVVE